MTARLYAFGGLRLEARGQPATGAPAQRRRLALLALLAGAGPRGLTREKALGYLWPEHATARARHQLSESLYVLRKFLGDGAIVTGQDDLRLDGSALWSDVTAFRSAHAAGDFLAAVSWYTGPFLDGFFLNDSVEFEHWVATEREALARACAQALECLAGQHAEQSDHVAAAEWWRRLAAHEPHSSRIALRYMEALAQIGDRARALEHARAYTTRLRDDVGVEPDSELLAFTAELQRATAPRSVARPQQGAGAASISAAPSADDLGQDFELVRVLGTGSVARVYLAKEPALRRLVAVKVLLPEFAAVETVRLRFEREAQSAARIQHPNVATAFRFGRMPSGAPFIVLPYIAGGSLADRLASAGPLPVPEAKHIIAQVAAGLAAAHRLGIVHRDVRPANVLCDRDSDRVLLTDFGLASVLDPAASESIRLTRPGESLGNVAYASPEQLRGEPVTERADIYSLGVLAFEMLTGRLPYDAASPVEVLIAHAAAQPYRLREFVSDIDERVEALVTRCLNKQPEQRPFALDVTNAANSMC
jgi:DNA-binding SARP family transcriptional activator